MNTKVAQIMGELRQRFGEFYGKRLVELILFGSQARGDAAPGSDIDVLVVLRGPVSPAREIDRVGAVTAALSLKHNAVVSCVFVSASRYVRERSPLLINIRREGVTA